MYEATIIRASTSALALAAAIGLSSTLPCAVALGLNASASISPAARD